MQVGRRFRASPKRGGDPCPGAYNEPAGPDRPATSPDRLVHGVRFARRARGLSLALLQGAQDCRLNAYVVLSLTVGIRTREARELHWDHVDLHGDPGAARPVPPSVAVWHSVRQGGDTKTARSRRKLALPQAAVQALKEHRKRQAEDRLAVGRLWQDHGLVFASALGTLWTRQTSGASSARSPKRQVSAPAWRRGTCDT